ncbi:MAG: xanthan lyase [Bacteroidales bacterium]|nr:xanthan lyase [Bacteroidales bacterium]
MKKSIWTILLALTLVCFKAEAQEVSKNAFKPVCDSLRTLLEERTTVFTKMSIDRVLKRSSQLDFYFSVELGDYPWHSRDINWFKATLTSLFPPEYSNCTVGNIYVRRNNLTAYVTPELGFDGKPAEDTYHYPAPRNTPLVTRKDAVKAPKGLDGRHIALWQSHGRYFEEETDRWEWQRAPMHGTIEDIYTQSIVLPFLIPMLENAGAYVMTPRERDTQSYEIIIDNDPSFTGERSGVTRRVGFYSEEGGLWSNAGTGFADSKRIYMLGDNPFKAGTAKETLCVSYGDEEVRTAKWSFNPPVKGSYAVYVSYKTQRNSTDAAHYTVNHAAGKTDFYVNQRMGGGTWIYLGTFDFGEEGSVTLDNVYPEGKTKPADAIVSADAVKIGGGVGKTARGLSSAPQSSYTTSGLASYLEGALYWLQWAGEGPELTDNWTGDYTKDLAGRGAWVTHLTGGSSFNPQKEGLKIPIDVSLGIHSDAGLAPNDSTIGTLAIYTLTADGKTTLPDGRSRYLCRTLADLVQSQICNDIRGRYNKEWSRRETYDRSYSESRTTSVPGIIIESLSHQNLSDMQYGLNPTFKFDLARAIYKGVLKFLSNEYSREYVVQPLPVNSLAVSPGLSGNAVLKWKPTEDPFEPTAVAKSYIVYTRVDDGVFDGGKAVDATAGDDGFLSVPVTCEKGHIYSFRVAAVNDGGKSFPSHIVSIGIPENAKGGSVLVVNNFDRVSGPTWFDSEMYGGFLYQEDGGVGYVNDLSFSGDVYEFRRDFEWIDDDNPGFGGSSIEHAGTIVPGNTFDYAIVHGRALMAAGRPFYSVSVQAWEADPSLGKGSSVVDIICGKQVTVPTGQESTRYSVFPSELQAVIKDYTSGGGNVIISGANIATDVWDRVFPIQIDKERRELDKEFVQTVLGYKWHTGHGSYTGEVVPIEGGKAISFHQKRNRVIYQVENPDGIVPANENGVTTMRYSGNNVPAAVRFKGKNYKVASFGFPLETIVDYNDMERLIQDTLNYFSN